MKRRSSAGVDRSARPHLLIPWLAGAPGHDAASVEGGWRDFLREIFIIVIGVLIALGADSVVATLRDRSASNEARAAIRDEIAENLGRMELRDATRACIDGRIAALADYLDRAAIGEPQPVLHWIGRPQVWPMLDSRWSATASAGKASLLPSKEQGSYGAIYANIRDFQSNQATEQLAWAQLRQMAEHPRISPQQDAVLRSALQNARYAAWLGHIIVWQVTQDAARLGIAPATEMKGSRSICIPTATAFADAVHQAGAGDFGEPR